VCSFWSSRCFAFAFLSVWPCILVYLCSFCVFLCLSYIPLVDDILYNNVLVSSRTCLLRQFSRFYLLAGLAQSRVNIIFTTFCVCRVEACYPFGLFWICDTPHIASENPTYLLVSLLPGVRYSQGVYIIEPLEKCSAHYTISAALSVHHLPTGRSRFINGATA